MTRYTTSLRIALLVTLLVPGLAPAQRSASGGGVATEKIFEAIGVREGIAVCEIGAGDGALTLEAARIVGPAGRVYTSELGDARVKTLQTKVADSHLAQVTVVTGDPDRTNFPDAGCDALFMRNVYHHFATPGPMNASIMAALKPGARLAVVDFGPPPGKDAASPADRAKDGSHGISAETLSRELAEAGFEAVSSQAGTERWFMVVVAKPRT